MDTPFSSIATTVIEDKKGNVYEDFGGCVLNAFFDGKNWTFKISYRNGDRLVFTIKKETQKTVIVWKTGTRQNETLQRTTTLEDLEEVLMDMAGFINDD